ncbi:MAG: glycosyltransferase family 2 protein, partial [Tepidiformaceae bacterium]
RQVWALRAAPDAGFALCQHVATFEPGTDPGGWYRGRIDGVPEPSFVPSAWLVRRSALLTVGGFDAALRHGEDTDWLARAKDAGVAFVMVDEPLLRKRIHSDSLGGTHIVLDDLFVILRRSAHRKQASLHEVPRGR